MESAIAASSLMEPFWPRRAPQRRGLFSRLPPEFWPTLLRLSSVGLIIGRTFMQSIWITSDECQKARALPIQNAISPRCSRPMGWATSPIAAKAPSCWCRSFPRASASAVHRNGRRICRAVVFRLRPVRGVDLEIGLGVARNMILWGVDSGQAYQFPDRRAPGSSA